MAKAQPKKLAGIACNGNSYQYCGKRSTLCTGIKVKGLVATKVIKSMLNPNRMYLSIESWIGTPDKISSKMRVRRSDFVSCATFSDLISIDVVLWITSFW